MARKVKYKNYIIVVGFMVKLMRLLLIVIILFLGLLSCVVKETGACEITFNTSTKEYGKTLCYIDVREHECEEYRVEIEKRDNIVKGATVVNNFIFNVGCTKESRVGICTIGFTKFYIYKNSGRTNQNDLKIKASLENMCKEKGGH